MADTSPISVKRALARNPKHADVTWTAAATTSVIAAVAGTKYAITQFTISTETDSALIAVKSGSTVIATLWIGAKAPVVIGDGSSVIFTVEAAEAFTVTTTDAVDGAAFCTYYDVLV